MAKKITVTTTDGATHEYKSTPWHGYHVVEEENITCVTEKRLFGKEQTIACFLTPKVGNIEEVRCKPCEAINPTQRKAAS